MLHFRGSIRDLDIGGNCQSQKSCNFDHFFVSRLPAALEQCRGGRGAQRGTVSGVGLGSMVWRKYGALGRYAHGAMERHRCSVANRRGYGVMGRCVPGIMERHGCNGVKRCERGAVGWCRCGAWSERGAAPWDGADSALWGAPAVTSWGSARCGGGCFSVWLPEWANCKKFPKLHR